MKRRFLPLVLVLGVGAFVFGLFELFKLRYEAGDVYPEYSSLRADPLGVMIFYESLAEMPHLTVRRDFSAQNKLPEDSNTAYLHLAGCSSDWTSMPVELFQEIERFLNRGGRLVVTFFPESRPATKLVTTPPAPAPKGKKSNSKKDDQLGRQTSLKERWGVDFGHVPLPRNDTSAYSRVEVENRSDLALPEILDWHSAMVFTNLDQSWETIYARQTHPVMVERKFGPGSVVMASDSYFLSNEAMIKDRHADLLAWLLGPSRTVVFDEAHFGILEAPGIATLMRQYRLHGLIVGLALLAALFIWKNVTSFVPPYPEERNQSEVAGREAAAGFVNLLRRNIAPKDLLRVCFDEWTKSLLQNPNHSIARVDQAQAILEAENARAQTERDPVRAYQEICHVLKGKKTH